MAAVQSPSPKLDRYIVVHVATTCDEHGVYVTKDSAEVIELGWILLDTKSCEEVSEVVRGLWPRRLKPPHTMATNHWTASPRECSCQAG